DRPAGSNRRGMAADAPRRRTWPLPSLCGDHAQERGGGGGVELRRVASELPAGVVERPDPTPRGPAALRHRANAGGGLDEPGPGWGRPAPFARADGGLRAGGVVAQPGPAIPRVRRAAPARARLVQPAALR